MSRHKQSLTCHDRWIFRHLSSSQSSFLCPVFLRVLDICLLKFFRNYFYLYQVVFLITDNMWYIKSLEISGYYFEKTILSGFSNLWNTLTPCDYVDRVTCWCNKVKMLFLSFKTLRTLIDLCFLNHLIKHLKITILLVFDFKINRWIMTLFFYIYHKRIIHSKICILCSIAPHTYLYTVKLYFCFIYFVYTRL